MTTTIQNRAEFLHRLLECKQRILDGFKTDAERLLLLMTKESHMPDDLRQTAYRAINWLVTLQMPDKAVTEIERVTR